MRKSTRIGCPLENCKIGTTLSFCRSRSRELRMIASRCRIRNCFKHRLHFAIIGQSTLFSIQKVLVYAHFFYKFYKHTHRNISLCRSFFFSKSSCTWKIVWWWMSFEILYAEKVLIFTELYRGIRVS